MQQIHDRQPIILDPAVYDTWLSPEASADEAKDLLGRNLNEQLQFYRVGRDVNAAAINQEPNDKRTMEPLNSL